MKNSVTGQNRVIRKKGDLTGAGKGDCIKRITIKYLKKSSKLPT